MLFPIQGSVFLLVPIATVFSVAVPPAQSEAQAPNIANLILDGEENLTSIAPFLANQRQRLTASEARCSETAWGHKLETFNVEAAYARIPDDTRLRYFSHAQMERDGAVRLPARFLGGGRAEFAVTTVDGLGNDITSWAAIKRAAAELLRDCDKGDGVHWGGVVQDVGVSKLLLVILHDPLTPFSFGPGPKVTTG